MTLTCTIPGGVSLGWRYNNVLIGGGTYVPVTNTVPPTNPDTVGGVVFTHSLLDSSPDLVSQLSFTASSDVNGGIIQCAGDAATSILVVLKVFWMSLLCKWSKFVSHTYNLCSFSYRV